jgi:vacuolar-type H+-ATPase subunit B/Vma2
VESRRAERALSRDHQLAEKVAHKISLQVFKGNYFLDRKKHRIRFHE